MRTLRRYLRPHAALMTLTLLLAGLAQVLALVDPLIFGRIVDRYVLNPELRPEGELVRGALGWLLVAAAVALAARLAGGLQDYALRPPDPEGRHGDVRRRPAPHAAPPVPGHGRPQQRGDGGSSSEGAHRHGAFRQRDGERVVHVPGGHRLPRLVRRHPALAAHPGVRDRRAGTQGLDTRVGEGGVRVSGGERQRLSIARALLRRPRLFIFDEATSSLDSITEREVSASVREVSGSRQHMVILIAHRLSTIAHADTIYVLERGRVTESGSHDALVEARGLYYAMWRQQIGERESEVPRPPDL